MENPKIFVKRTMSDNPFSMAPVEIIIPFHDNQSDVTRLVEGIFQTVHTNRYLISLVDDGSKNKTFIKQIDKKKIPGVRCFQREKSEGFEAAVNFVLDHPFTNEIPWVCIMKPEVAVEDMKWLSAMGDTLNKLKIENIKMVGPLTNNPGVNFVFLEGKKGVQKEDYTIVEGFLPTYCVLAHRELFSRVGPLTEAKDYAARMAQLGFKQAVSGQSWVNRQ